MAKIKIVADSTCDLPANYLRDYDIGIVPINIQFGNDSFQEGVNIDQTTFYKKVEELGIIPQTSQPSVGQFIDAYRAYARQGYDTIISLHVTGKLSGTLNSAMLAAQQIESEIRVLPYDSQAGSAALGFMCVDAVEMARAGNSADDILATLDRKRPLTRIFLTLASTKYAQMSGRISNFQGFLAAMLNIKPIVSLQEGNLLPTGRVRTRAASLAHLLELTKDAAGNTPVKFAVIHGEALEEAQPILEQGKKLLNCTDTFIDDVAISLAVHFGPGVIGTVIYPA